MIVQSTWVRRSAHLPALTELLDTMLDQRRININGYNFAKNQPPFYFLALPVLELNDFRYLAFHSRATFEHARDVNVFTGHGRQSGQLKLVHIVWNGQRGTVHLFGELFGRQIPDKLPGLRDVSDTVLPGDRSKSQDRRIIIEGVEKAVRS